MVRTSAAGDTIDAATVDRMARATSGPPVKELGNSSNSKARSMAIVPNDRSTPPATHTTGTNHIPDRTLLMNLKILTSCHVPTFVADTTRGPLADACIPVYSPAFADGALGRDGP